MPSSAASWSVLEDLHHRQIVEKSRLITMSAHEPSQFNSVEWKVHNFYESCMALGKSFSLCDTDWTVNDVVFLCKLLAYGSMLGEHSHMKSDGFFGIFDLKI